MKPFSLFFEDLRERIKRDKRRKTHNWGLPKKDTYMGSGVGKWEKILKSNSLFFKVMPRKQFFSPLISQFFFFLRNITPFLGEFPKSLYFFYRYAHFD